MLATYPNPLLCAITLEEASATAGTAFLLLHERHSGYHAHRLLPQFAGMHADVPIHALPSVSSQSQQVNVFGFEVSAQSEDARPSPSISTQA